LGAIEGLTKSVAAEELPKGMVVVIALNPGVINTDMLASCYGVSSSLYQSPKSWVRRQPPRYSILHLQTMVLLSLFEVSKLDI